jgi:argininosuccinate lyase
VTKRPPRYQLGARGQIDKPPAAELLESGFASELRDAGVLHSGLVLSHLAHVLELDRAGALPKEHCRLLLGGLLELMEAGPSGVEYDARHGDAFNCQERWLEQRLGPAAGWLTAGRARREAGRVAYRLALRASLVRVAQAAAELGGSLVGRSEDLSSAIAPDYTYLQVAQLTTFGHYLLSFAFPVLRDIARLRRAHAWANMSPAGVGAVAGSRFQPDRERLAARLGFEAPVLHTRDAMWQTDGLGDALLAASSLAGTCGSLASDLEIYGSAEFGFVRLDASACRASAVMPQKRNPYSLAVMRGVAGLLIGRLTGVLAMQRTPSARTDNVLYSFHETIRGVAEAEGAVRLASTVVATLHVEEERLRERAGDARAVATDVAEMLALAAGLDYRSAYDVVAHAVAGLEEGGQETSTRALLDALEPAAREVLGESLELPRDAFAGAEDPRAVLEGRATLGGAGDRSFQDMLSTCRESLAETAQWLRDAEAASAGAEQRLLADARLAAEAGGAPEPAAGYSALPKSRR